MGAEETRKGDLLGSRYELIERVASGKTYDTYRATDRTNGRAVRVRLLRTELALQSKVVQRFLATPKALIGLSHPNLARCLAVESDETGIPYVVEEHVDGEPLSRVLARSGKAMPLAEVLQVIVPVAEAIAAVHARGVTHGQLDRERVLLKRQAPGLAVKVVHGLGDEPRASQPDDLAKRAPELRGGSATAEPRADVWAIGALLYEALSGRAPSGSERAKPRAPLGKCAPELPSDLLQLVERCLADEPSKRPAHGGEVRDALYAVQERSRSHASSATGARDAQVAAERLKLALSATIAVPVQAPAPMQAPAPVPQRRAPAMDSLPIASHAPARVPPADDDEPEIAIQPVTRGLAQRLAQAAIRHSGPPPSLHPVEIKTVRDLAAAFAPMEGADRIGQAEVDGAARGRAFRQAIDDEQAETKAARRRPSAARPGASAQQPEPRPAPLGSPRQLRAANALALPSPLQAQWLRQREGTPTLERSRDRIVGELLFFAFAFALLFAIPLLWDPTRARARALLGAQCNPAIGALALLSVIALLRTWSTQLQLRPFMLRPVTMSLKVLTASVCVLSATYFLPDGALGPAERTARYVLPWASGSFYLFLALYGILQAAHQGASNAPGGIALALLYSSFFFGSYQALASTVLGGR